MSAEQRARERWGTAALALGAQCSIPFDVAFSARKFADSLAEHQAILRCESGEGSQADLGLVADVLDRGGAYDLAGALRWVLP